MELSAIANIESATTLSDHSKYKTSLVELTCFTSLLAGNLLLTLKQILENLGINKTLGRALDPRANGTWLSKLTEINKK